MTGAPQPRAIAGTFFELLGIDIVEATPQEVIATIAIGPSHLNPGGQVHGGVLVGLADSVCGYGCRLNLPDAAAGFATVDLTTHFLASAAAGDTIVGTARPLRLGRTLHLWDATITTSARPDRVLAHFRSTLMVLAAKGDSTVPQS